MEEDKSKSSLHNNPSNLRIVSKPLDEPYETTNSENTHNLQTSLSIIATPYNKTDSIASETKIPEKATITTFKKDKPPAPNTVINKSNLNQQSNASNIEITSLNYNVAAFGLTTPVADNNINDNTKSLFNINLPKFSIGITGYDLSEEIMAKFEKEQRVQTKQQLMEMEVNNNVLNKAVSYFPEMLSDFEEKMSVNAHRRELMEISGTSIDTNPFPSRRGKLSIDHM